MDLEAGSDSTPRQWGALVTFAVSSIAMILLNKGVMMEFREPIVVILAQNLCTVIILQFFTKASVFGLDAENARKWAICAALFCLNLFSSLMSLVFIRAPTFMVLRNVQPIVACAVECVMERRIESLSDFHFLFCILMGTVMYAYNDLQFDVLGYIWAMIHVFSMTAYAIVVRMRQDAMDISVPEMSMYNNVLSIPVFFVSLFFKMPRMDVDGVSAAWWAVFAASCICAAAISTSGFAAQKVVSPTSWLTLNNASKIPAILLAYLFFGGMPNMLMGFGMAISLVSAYFYALSRVEGMRPVQAGTYTVFTSLVVAVVTTCSTVHDPLANGCGAVFAFDHFF